MSVNRKKKHYLKFEYEGMHYPVELLQHMEANNHNGLPDGAWWAMLECAAEEWTNSNGFTHLDSFDAVHAFLNWRNPEALSNSTD